VLKIQFNF